MGYSPAVGDKTFPIILENVLEVITVSDPEIVEGNAADLGNGFEDRS